MLPEGFYQPQEGFFILVSSDPPAQPNENTWYFEDKLIDSGPYTISSTHLSLPSDVTPALAGDYACIVDTTAGRAVANFTLIVISKLILKHFLFGI